MGEGLLRAEVQALKERLCEHRGWLQRLDIEDNMIELKIVMQGRVRRLSFILYEADAYPNSGGMMMSEDDADTSLVEAINALLTAESLTILDVLRATSRASKVADADLLALLSCLDAAGAKDQVEADNVDFEGDDEGLDLRIEAPEERSERPGWKRMKWQEVEDQRLEDQRLAQSQLQKRRKGELSNEELRAKGEQIFNSSEAFNILSNELFNLQTQVTPGVEADAVNFNVHSWVVKLRGFSKDIALDLQKLKACCGYDYVELRVNFREDLHPFYPPSVSIVRPRLLGRHDVQAALACHPRLQLKGWSPFQSSKDLLVSIRNFLDRIARVDLESNRNAIDTFPEGAFSVVEQQLGLLRRLRDIVPVDLRLETLGNAYEDDPWAQSEELRSSSFSAMFSRGRKLPSASGTGTQDERSFWAAGVGYGSDAGADAGRDGWDPAALRAAQEAQEPSRLHLERELSGELSTSYTSMGDRCSIFREVLDLVRQLLSSLPQHAPQLLQPIRGHLASAKAAAETFQRCLGESASHEDAVRDVAFAELVVATADDLERLCRLCHAPSATPTRGATQSEYCRSLGVHQLNTSSIEDGHAFEQTARSEHCVPQARTVRLAKELAGLAGLLPLSDSSSVLVRSSARQQQLWRALITGPEETPYSGGCFVFDIYFPVGYPSCPLEVKLLTTGGGTVCFNPNLYSNGKVCLSLLGTWQGQRSERWDSQSSRAVQVLVSIQSLILVPQPYFNEPGFETQIGTPPGDNASKAYNAAVRENCIRWAMIEVLRRPSPEFAEAIKLHFKLRRSNIQETVAAWIEEADTALHRAKLIDLSLQLNGELQRL
ncbi:unnamed protein product [Symbiodinium pilosum]|uniref:UBC core domain-containing protein n=1 Tax=Symbiodinium pilosum TaxID=2952 RepID=A0A812W4L1_SYMPI|nr:unnamed protein product [Symbiodinium pilosum]